MIYFHTILYIICCILFFNYCWGINYSNSVFYTPTSKKKRYCEDFFDHIIPDNNYSSPLLHMSNQNYHNTMKQNFPVLQ